MFQMEHLSRFDMEAFNPVLSLMKISHKISIISNKCTPLKPLFFTDIFATSVEFFLEARALLAKTASEGYKEYGNDSI